MSGFFFRISSGNEGGRRIDRIAERVLYPFYAERRVDVSHGFDCAILGAGPGGYVAAIRLAQQGRKVALVEAKELGGSCLNVGCIPTKALLSSAELYEKMRHASEHGIQVSGLSVDYAKMVHRKDEVVQGIRKSLETLLRANHIEIFRGWGELCSPEEIHIKGESSTRIQAKRIILAMGSEPKEIPLWPFDGTHIHSSTTILAMKELPKRLAIVGGGWIGCEAASLYRSLGVEVFLLEMMERLLPNEGSDMAHALQMAFEKQGISVQTGVRVTGIEKGTSEVDLFLEDGESIRADSVLIAVGRSLNTEGIGLEEVGIALDKGGAIPVNGYLETALPHVYAIGDITAMAMLAHVASHQGVCAADNVAGQRREMHYNAIPSVVFTHPEVATVGLTLEAARKAGHDAEAGRFPFQALGRSVATGQTEGFARVVVDRNNGAILGAQVMGEGATTLIAQMTQAIANELTVECIEETIHAHPTISEAWHEATLLAAGRPLHLPPRSRTGSRG